MTNDDVPIVSFLAPCPNGHRASQTFRADDITPDTIDDITFHCITCDASWKPNDAEKPNVLARAQREQRPTPPLTTTVSKRCSGCGAMIDIEYESSGFGHMAEYARHCPTCGKVIRVSVPGNIVASRLAAPANRNQDGR